MNITITRRDITGGVESISEITIVNASPIAGTAKIEIRTIGINPTVVQLKEPGIPGPQGPIGP